MAAVTYEQRRSQVLALRAEGLTLRQIAERLGVSRSHVGHIASARTYENGLRLSSEAKQRRTGTCSCGAVTRYNGHQGSATSRFCLPCAAARSGEAARGTGATQARVFAFLGDGERRFMEIAEGCGLSKGETSSLLHRLRRYGLIERPRRGVYRRASA